MNKNVFVYMHLSSSFKMYLKYKSTSIPLKNLCVLNSIELVQSRLGPQVLTKFKIMAKKTYSNK